MDGKTRSSIRPGLRVAVVLKEDQPTGKRTVGEVAQILTSDSSHHRGIKVRLKDGQVGRVQEILGSAPASGPKSLIVLTITSSSGSLYARKLELPDGTIFTLGMDSAGGGSPQNQITKLMSFISSGGHPPKLLFSSPMTIETEKLVLHAYTCVGEVLRDPQSNLWTWTGWLTSAEVEELGERGELSQESELIFRRLKSSR